MKILFLANRTPYPPYRGDKLKIYNLAKRLYKQHELHLVTFAQTVEDQSYQAELEKVFKEVHQVYLPKSKSAMNCLTAVWDPKPLQVLYFQSAEMKKVLADILSKHKFDAVHVQHLRMSPYLAHVKDVPRILDFPDAFSLYWERRKKAQKNPLKKIFEAIEHKRVLKYESILHEYNLSLVCSLEDMAYMRKTHNADTVKLLPNGVDIDTFACKGHNYEQNDVLLFTGNMDYAPNVDGVIYFAEEILPKIRAKHPHIKFVIAGQRPVSKVQELANDHIQVTGFVEDLAEMYRSASIVVSPLRFGAGTQNKVLEAMAMGVPVVCSNIGFNGLGIKSGEGAIMETDPNMFADMVNELLSSSDKRKQVGTEGKNVIHNRFSWDIIAKQLEQYFIDIAK